MQMQTTPKFKAHWLWMIPVLLLTMWMTSRHLLTDTYWFDELTNLWKMGIPPYPPANLLDIVTNVGVTRWPPAYNFVLLPWGALAGWSEFSTRTLSLFMGVLSVASMYQFGKTLVSRQVGFIGAVLLGTSVFFLFYAHEVRGYIQYLMLSIIVMTIYAKHSKRPTLRNRDGILFIGLSIVLIYTHYVALYVVTALGVYHLFFAPRKNQWFKRLSWLILIGISFIPWVAIAFLNALGETTMIRGLSIPVVIESLLHGYSNGLAPLFLILIIYALVIVRNRITTTLALWGTVFLGLVFITNFLTDFLFHIRHIIGILPILLVLCAIAIQHLLRFSRGLAWIVVIGWVIMGGVHNRDLAFMDELIGALDTRPRPMMVTAVEDTDQCATPDDFVITHLAKEAHIWNVYIEQYYFNFPDFGVAMIQNLADYSQAGWDEITSEGTYEERLASITDSTRVWVTVGDDAYETSQISDLSQTLSDAYDYCDVVSRGNGVDIYAYQNTSDFTCNANAQTLPTCAPDLLTIDMPNE